MAGPQSTKFAAFQFYPGDFLSSSKVRRMSLAEVGAYITLLCFQWLDGSLPSDLPTLARMLRIPGKQLEKLWTGGPLPDCFTVRGTRMANARLERTRKALAEYVEHQRAQGRKGGLAKARNSIAMKSPAIKASERLATGVANPSSSSSSSSSTSNGTTTKNVVVPLNEHEHADVAFAEFRDAYPRSRRKGGPLVEQAFLRALELAGGFPPILAALRNHLASEQWANPRMVPGMDVWFEEERWRQELPAAGAVTASGNNPKTAGNVAALQRFIDRGRTA